MAALPPADPQQQKLEKAVTKMPKPKELAPPEFAQDEVPAPGSGPFGTALTGAGSIPSAPTITSNVTGDKTPQPLLQSTTDIGKEMTKQQKEPMKMARLIGGKLFEPGQALGFLGDEHDARRAVQRAINRAQTQRAVQEQLSALKEIPGKVKETVVEDILPVLNPSVKESRYKLSRRMKFRDLNISVETDKGEKRHWYDPHNKEKGTTTMTHPYGYIRRTKGVDGDHVDVYVGPNEQAKNVYIVHQMKAPDFKKYDEDKCMLGFDSAAAAKAAYLKNFNDDRFFGSITTMPYDDFKKKVLKSFDLKRPHKIAEAIMNPHLKTSYLFGADQAKIAFEKAAAALAPQATTPAPTAVPVAATVPQQPNILGGLLDTAESGLGSLYEKGKAGLTSALGTGEGALDKVLAALKKKKPVKPEPKKEASAALAKLLLAGGGLGAAGLGVHKLLQGSRPAQQVSGERTSRGLEAAGIGGLGKAGQAMPEGEPMMPPDQAAADTAAPPELPPEAAAAPGLGDPNFWGGGAAGSPEAAAAGAGSAEEVIGLLPAGTFQGMNVRITPDGQKPTGLKVSPEAIDAPEALKAVFQAEPSARVEITTPDTPSSVTSFKEGVDRSRGPGFYDRARMAIQKRFGGSIIPDELQYPATQDAPKHDPMYTLLGKKGVTDEPQAALGGEEIRNRRYSRPDELLSESTYEPAQPSLKEMMLAKLGR
jgi:hypothetical protein